MAQQAAPADPLAGHPRYRKIKDINKGSFGFVVLAENLESREQVAIKFTRVDTESDVKHAHREIMNHQRLLHPHVVQLKEVFSAKPYLALVMEFVPNGDMFQYVVSRRGLPESEARWFFQQLMLGMDYCHRKGVMSRDIKLENTLLVLQPDKKPLLKLCDFGYSKHDTLDSIAKSKVGTPGYTAPEVIQNIRGYDGKMADVWSAGVMLYTMLFARYPFERPEDKKLNQHDRLQRILHRIIKVDFVFPESPAISPECRDLIQRILVANPAQRLTIAQIFQHPWVQQDLPQGSLEYNNWALALQVQPAQGDDEVRAVVGEVYTAAKAQAQQANAAAYAGDDDIIDSQEYRDYKS
ncbi:sulfur stress regulator [Chlorella sorokiniana]|uniref:Sulfur stress regulator n=1 Tax=Chlorella sorokiniana TaxID=3076 RepID=A0A2P6TYU2_CHLSO|nr:sulfur stress regulator [Chlorella sorokiniana]|eukprot:PRW59234.1 sulfur stress regulator [Chlorella sorokiniana]